MDKTAIVLQLMERIRESLGVAEREMVAAADAARDGEDAQTRREDTRMALEYGALAHGQKRRAEQARQMLAELEGFRPGPLPPSGVIEVGALVEIEDEDTGDGRTFFLAPVGAGIELTGPGGDGFFVVVTPTSPIGRAVRGHTVGDSVDVTVDGTTRRWEITWAA
ncbi:MAG: GreA/GreB family elongation factor [Deltaproteobacteria bacterium]|nr:GreA/GreB family elongation factor [Deltaproteobacteria bacterium]